MNDTRQKDIDSENIKIAEKIRSDSRNIKLNQAANQKIIGEIRSNRGKKLPFYKIYKTGTAVAACIVLAVGLIVWNQTRMGNLGNTEKAVEETETVQKDSEKIVSAVTNSVKLATSYDEIKEKIREALNNENERILESTGTTKSNADDFSPLVSADVVDGTASRSNNSYSDTNVQTTGVDEGDIVKTDGKYIYTLSEKYIKDNITYRVVITEVSGKKMKEAGTIELNEKRIGKDAYVPEIYVQGNRLVVIATTAYYTCGVMEDYAGGFSENSDQSETTILIYDISDIQSPKLIGKNRQDGHYNESRIADGYLYTVSFWSAYDSEKGYIPKVNGKKIPCDSIYLPKVVKESSYSIITSINLEEGKDIKDSISVLGNGSKIYVSKDNIYLVNETYSEKDLSDTEEGKKIIKRYRRKRNISSENRLSDEEIAELKEDYDNEYDFSLVTKKFVVTVKEYSYKMEILKYQYKEGNLILIADCDLEGVTDDRFSLDEKDGYLRLVANIDTGRELSASYVYYDADNKEIQETYYDSETLKGGENSNTVYTLDDFLRIKGKISGLAEGEQIYAARYMGNYGYFVTYEETDPLFTVDFTDMENPKIVGELKMPGYSDYLQFYNEKLLFGIGVDDTSDQDWSLIKLDMYCVEEGSATREAMLTLNSTTDSPALYASKTLFMDSEKNLIGFPATDYVGNANVYEVKDYYYLFSYKNGIFRKLKKIEIEGNMSYATRGLYINNYFYIVTSGQIIAVNMSNYKIMGKISIK